MKIVKVMSPPEVLALMGYLVMEHNVAVAPVNVSYTAVQRALPVPLVALGLMACQAIVGRGRKPGKGGALSLAPPCLVPNVVSSHDPLCSAHETSRCLKISFKCAKCC